MCLNGKELKDHISINHKVSGDNPTEKEEMVHECSICGKNTDKANMKTHKRFCTKPQKIIENEKLIESPILVSTNSNNIDQETNQEGGQKYESAENSKLDTNQELFKNSSLTSIPTISFGFVECTICDLSFYGTNATLNMHMADVHEKQIQYIEAQNGEEIIQVFINYKWWNSVIEKKTILASYSR